MPLGARLSRVQARIVSCFLTGRAEASLRALSHSRIVAKKERLPSAAFNPAGSIPLANIPGRSFYVFAAFSRILWTSTDVLGREAGARKEDSNP